MKSSVLSALLYDINKLKLTTWERKALTFISQTSDWDRNGSVTSFLSFSIALLRELTGAFLSLELDMEDQYTVRVKEATPEYLNDLVFNPAPITQLLEQHAYKVIAWPQIPERNAFEDLLSALSSAVVLPVKSGEVNALILLGWSEPQQFDAAFRESVEIIRSRLKEILWQVNIQQSYQSTIQRFSGILETVPQAIVFIGNDGKSGWVNTKGQVLLQLEKEGELPLYILSGAMAKLISSAANKDAINREAVKLFTSSDGSLTDMLWELPEQRLLVSCLPVEGKGKLWLFREK
jgi:hypothetical protein